MIVGFILGICLIGTVSSSAFAATARSAAPTLTPNVSNGYGLQYNPVTHVTWKGTSNMRYNPANGYMTPCNWKVCGTIVAEHMLGQWYFKADPLKGEQFVSGMWFYTNPADGITISKAWNSTTAEPLHKRVVIGHTAYTVTLTALVAEYYDPYYPVSSTAESVSMAASK